MIGKIFQIIDDIHDYEHNSNELINILNVMTKDDALLRCQRYEMQAESYRKKLFSNGSDRMRDILSFIINRKY